jgi:hypothetical protein
MAGLWVFMTYHGTLRPWLYGWGATVEETYGRLPGDQLVAPGKLCSTRAITVAAKPEQVWPWLAQIGENRGGFYSYSLLERAAGAQISNADHIHPEWQRLDVGDTVWLAHRYGSTASEVVAEIVPDSHLILVSQPDYKRLQRGQLARGSWGFHLSPQVGGTRLIVRSTGGWIGNPVFDLVHFLMERKMLRGIASRAATVVSLSQATV